MDSPEELLARVSDRETFLAFLKALADEREEAEDAERADPALHRLDGATRWKNCEISAFLYAALSYFDRQQQSDAPASWRAFAEALYLGKILD